MRTYEDIGKYCAEVNRKIKKYSKNPTIQEALYATLNSGIFSWASDVLRPSDHTKYVPEELCRQAVALVENYGYGDLVKAKMRFGLDYSIWALAGKEIARLPKINELPHVPGSNARAIVSQYISTEAVRRKILETMKLPETP